MTTKLPQLTPKQQIILHLLYQFRFLNRPQIQALLNHKDKRRIISWLKDLREKQYLDWNYNANDFIAKSQPAIYYLSLNGIRFLRGLDCYPAEELRIRYKEQTRSQVFINRCLLIADCCLALKSKCNDELNYLYVLPADYSDPNNQYHFLNDLKPHLFFTKQNGDELTSYVLENFELTLPRYQLRKRIKDYVNYIHNWEEDKILAPVALFVCATTTDLIYAKRRVKIIFEDFTENENIRIRVTTIDKVRSLGITATIWEEI